MLSGEAEQVWPNGDRFRGQWHLNKREGLGVMKHADGTEIEGRWADNHSINPVKFRFSNGTVFEGELCEEKPHGRGVLLLPSSSGPSAIDRIDGFSFDKGVPIATHSMVKITLASGSVYEGPISGRLREGIGALLFFNGDRYRGEWKADKRHGPPLQTPASCTLLPLLYLPKARVPCLR